MYGRVFSCAHIDLWHTPVTVSTRECIWEGTRRMDVVVCTSALEGWLPFSCICSNHFEWSPQKTLLGAARNKMVLQCSSCVFRLAWKLHVLGDICTLALRWKLALIELLMCISSPLECSLRATTKLREPYVLVSKSACSSVITYPFSVGWFHTKGGVDFLLFWDLWIYSLFWWQVRPISATLGIDNTYIQVLSKKAHIYTR